MIQLSSLKNQVNMGALLISATMNGKKLEIVKCDDD